MQNSGNRHTVKLLVFALIAALGLAGCGKKDWPSVQTREDVLTWEEVSVEREPACLNISARLGGAAHNLAGVLLELEGSPQACPECPFLPSRRIFFEVSAPQVQMTGSRLQISHCGLKAEQAYRLRLRGTNRMPGIEDSVSKVLGPFAQ